MERETIGEKTVTNSTRSGSYSAQLDKCRVNLRHKNEQSKQQTILGLRKDNDTNVPSLCEKSLITAG